MLLLGIADEIDISTEVDITVEVGIVMNRGQCQYGQSDSRAIDA